MGILKYLLDWVLGSISEDKDIRIEKIALAEADINPCRGCNACETLNKCVQRDGMDIYHDKIIEADCIILSSPIYCMGLAAQVKALVDRAQVFRSRKYVLNLPVVPPERKGKRLGVFSRLYLEAGLRLGLGVDDLRLDFPVPIVERHCRHSGHGGYRGFERQPVSGACPVCGEKTICSAAPRNLSLEEAGDLAHRSLRELNNPAGMRFSAWARDGRTADFHLPFRMEDVPALPQGM